LPFTALARALKVMRPVPSAGVFGRERGSGHRRNRIAERNHQVELPPWIGAEVTGQSQYYNGTLSQNPYSRWAQDDAAERSA